MGDEVAPPAAVSDTAGETYSKEYVEKLKADLAAKNEEASKLKAFKQSHDDKQREVISKLQPDIQSYIEGLAKDNADYAQDMRPLVEWSRSCHESQSLETAMPLARVISCASAAMKRTREEASMASEKANSLGAAMKELEELKAADSAKAQRITELEQLANERQEANSKLQDELAKAGIIKDKFDFSKVASREASPKEEGTKAPAVVDAPTGEAGLKTVTSNASRGPVALEDELMSFVRGSSSGIGSSKLFQSSTAHSLLGATQGGLEQEIASASAFGF